MPVHLHTTIPRKTNQILEELAKTYGTKNRVLQQALETLLRVEKVGSCEDCVVKARMKDQMNLREALDLTCLRRKTLDDLLEVAVGDSMIQDFIEGQREDSQNLVEVLKRVVDWKSPSDFKEFNIMLEEIGNLTRMFEIASHSDIENTLILRPKTLRRVPEIVAFQLAVLLEGVAVPFEIRMMGEDIAVKMMLRETYPLRKTEFGEYLSKRLGERLATSRSRFFRDSLMLVGPSFMQWAEKHLEEPITNLGSIIEDFKTALEADELPRDPEKFVRILLSACVKMNWFRQARITEGKDDQRIGLTFQATSPSVARLAIATLSVLLATRGWKLLDYSLEYTTANMTIKFVGAEDQGLLDQVGEMSLYQTIGKQFLDVIPIPREVYDSFASRVYETNRQRFDDIHRSMGVRIAKAIRMLSREDTDRIGRLSRNFLLKHINSTQPDAEVRYTDDNHFSIIFKRVDPLAINGQRTLVSSMFTELGYEVSTSVFQNLLSVKLTHLERPVLEPIPRKELMKALIGEMSASSAEDAFEKEKDYLSELFPDDYPWTIREVGDRLIDMYRELDIEVEIEYFEGGFILKYNTCPYYELVKSGQKTWLCTLRKKTLEYIISRVTHGRKGKIKIIKSLLQNEHPCEYAIFLTGFLEKE